MKGTFLRRWTEECLADENYLYNSRHQQTKVETEDGKVQENRYDAEDLRFELLENGRETRFVYHDGELLHEEGGDREETSYHIGAKIDAFQRNGQTFYYHQDEQLSTAFITDGNADIQNGYQHDAFGNELESSEQMPNRIRYTGQQYDNLTEQYYLRARYYNPILGRFMQEDAYQGDGLNLYAYCGNNPVVYYDPSGYKLTEEDINRLQIDFEGSNYTYYQNTDYKHGLKNRGLVPTVYQGTSFQAHHLLQGEWARQNLHGYGYDYQLAPTVSLGTGYYDINGERVAAPHTILNNRQNGRARARAGTGTGANANYTTTLNDELIFGATDLLAAGMSESVVMSELERNYRMLDALNRQKKADIDAGKLPVIEYDKEKIEKAVHDKAEEMNASTCKH